MKNRIMVGSTSYSDGFTMVNSESKKHSMIMEIANELFPISETSVNFIGLSMEQRNDIYREFSKRTGIF